MRNTSYLVRLLSSFEKKKIKKKKSKKKKKKEKKRKEKEKKRREKLSSIMSSYNFRRQKFCKKQLFSPSSTYQENQSPKSDMW